MAEPTPLHDEPLITLGQAARKFPGHRGADRLHPATLTRWILIGVTAPDGQRVRLEAVRIGCRWLTSEAALRRFALALTSPPTDSNPVAAVPTPMTRLRASERAAKELQRRGA